MLTARISYEDHDDVEVIMGGIRLNDPPDWSEYREIFHPASREYLSAMRRCIEESGMVGTKGGDVCNQIHFVFSDGVRWGLTWRAWGDLMQAIVGKREGYMTYYM